MRYLLYDCIQLKHTVCFTILKVLSNKKKSIFASINGHVHFLTCSLLGQINKILNVVIGKQNIY